MLRNYFGSSFDSLSAINWYCPHYGMNKEELRKEKSQQEGLFLDADGLDLANQRFLLKEKHSPENQEYSRCENPPRKKVEVRHLDYLKISPYKTLN